MVSHLAGAKNKPHDRNRPLLEIESAMLAGERVVLAAAANHTIVSTDTARVYTFGRGDEGRLGHGGEVTRIVLFFCGEVACEQPRDT